MDFNKLDLNQIVRLGLLWGGAAAYVSVIGMVQSFGEREIISGLLTLSRVLLFLPPVMAGYMVAKRGWASTETPNVLLGGDIAGFMAAMPVTIVILLEAIIPNLREMFVNISPDLISILTFGMNRWLGLIVMLIAYAVLGLMGAGFTILPERASRAVGQALVWVLGLGIFGELLVQVLRPWFGNGVVNFLFRSGALRVVTVIIIAAVAGGLGWFRQENRARYSGFVGGLSESGRRNFYYAQIGISALLMVLLPFIVGRFLSDVLVTIGLYIMMGLGLNIAIGMAGLLDLGYVTNYAVGAYVMGVLTTVPPTGGGFGWPFWAVLPLCLLAAMCIGFIFGLPVLKMRGDYLAIATLGFGEIIRILAISNWLEPYIGGAQGVLYIPKPSFFGIELRNPQQLYFVVLAGCAFVLYVVWRLNNSRAGRQWNAMREDEAAAEAMGINLTRVKLLAFTVSAAAGGLAGGMFATKLGTIFPTSFNAFVSINVLSLIIVGGMGSIPGIIVGAIALVGLPELLREFSEYRLLIYGAVLVWMMLTRPEGLIPSAVRKRELKSGADSL